MKNPVLSSSLKRTVFAFADKLELQTHGACLSPTITFIAMLVYNQLRYCYSLKALLLLFSSMFDCPVVKRDVASTGLCMSTRETSSER